MILLLSIIGTALFCFFLLSPALLLPADPAFSQINIGKASVMIKGESWVPIYGMHLLFHLTGLVHAFLLILLVLTAALMLFLSPFIAFMQSRKLLVVLTISAVINLIGLGSVITVFSPYLESSVIALGCIAIIMILASVYLRNTVLSCPGTYTYGTK